MLAFDYFMQFCGFQGNYAQIIFVLSHVVCGLGFEVAGKSGTFCRCVFGEVVGFRERVRIRLRCWSRLGIAIADNNGIATRETTFVTSVVLVHSERMSTNVRI